MKSKVLSGMAWKFAERILAQGVSLLVSIVLARILMPEDYGVVSLVMVFIAIANVFVSNGFSTALIQAKEINEIDYSTMFYCSLFFSAILYFVVFISAPFIEQFYAMNSLCIVLRILAIKLPISAINSIQHAYVSKKMQFRRFFWSTFIGTAFSGVVGIYMAMRGFGVWLLCSIPH